MTVFYHSKIAELTLYSIFRSKHIAHLDVNGAALSLCHEVDFCLMQNTYIDSITKSQKMTINSILHYLLNIEVAVSAY